MEQVDRDKWASFTEVARKDGSRIEQVIKRVYESHISTAGNAVDGGANVGLHTRGLSDHLRGGSVIAVEANEATFRRLELQTATRTNLHRHLGALQDDPQRTEITFNCSPSHPGRSGISRIWDRIAPGQVEYADSVTVPATTIDKLVDEARWLRLDFVKLDLEGGEFPALRGGAASLKRFRPLVVTEHSIHAPAANGFEIGQYFDWLSSIGYVAMDPAGLAANVGRPFPFWYLFLAPEEEADRWRNAMQTTLREFI